MRSYQTARTYFTLLEMASWAAIALGALLGIFGLLAAFSANTAGGAVAFLAFGTALLPAFAFCGAGLAGLVYAQTARAGVDSAEYALQGLQIARESLEVPSAPFLKADLLRRGTRPSRRRTLAMG
ncbi:MAG: hypothetical protein AAF194_01230 [Pseudomonadota bacterium]